MKTGVSEVLDAWLQALILVGFALVCFVVVSMVLVAAAAVWVFLLPGRLLRGRMEDGGGRKGE